MDLENMKRKYAYTLARVGLNVQKGQTVLVEAALEGWQFTSIFAEECYKLGAGNVVVNYLDQANLKVAAHYRPDADVRRVEDWERSMYQKYLDEGACYVRLEGVNPQLMEGVSEKESNAIFAHVDGVRNIMRKASREKRCQWLIAMVPTVEWAEYILDKKGEEALQELWEILLKLCYIDEDNDVVKTWEELRAQKAARGKAVDALKLTKLHYTAGNGTDLTVGLTPWSKFGHEGAPAIPFTPTSPPRKSAPPPPSTRQTAWCTPPGPWCWAARRLRTSASALKRARWWRSWPAPARRCWKLWWPPTKTPATWARPPWWSTIPPSA